MHECASVPAWLGRLERPDDVGARGKDQREQADERHSDQPCVLFPTMCLCCLYLDLLSPFSIRWWLSFQDAAPGDVGEVAHAASAPTNLTGAVPGRRHPGQLVARTWDLARDDRVARVAARATSAATAAVVTSLPPVTISRLPDDQPSRLEVFTSPRTVLTVAWAARATICLLPGSAPLAVIIGAPAITALLTRYHIGITPGERQRDPARRAQRTDRQEEAERP